MTVLLLHLDTKKIPHSFMTILLLQPVCKLQSSKINLKEVTIQISAFHCVYPWFRFLSNYLVEETLMPLEHEIKNRKKLVGELVNS